MSNGLAAIEEGGNLAPRLCPGDGLYLAGIEFLDAPSNLLAPCLFDGRIYGIVEALEERSRQGSAGLRRQGQGFLQKFGNFFSHKGIVPHSQVSKTMGLGAPGTSFSTVIDHLNSFIHRSCNGGETWESFTGPGAPSITQSMRIPSWKRILSSNFKSVGDSLASAARALVRASGFAKSTSRKLEQN